MSDPQLQGSFSTIVAEDEVSQDDHVETEAELRQMYDNEELDRFFHLFSNYVTEFRIPGSTTTDVGGSDSKVNQSGSSSAAQAGSRSPPPLPPRPSEKLKQRSWSEYIAYRYVVPYMPPAPPPAPPFTVKRFRLSSQRVYLAVVPPYKSFLVHTARLALWEDYRKSSAYCTLFWVLWYHNLLLPALALRILIALVQRRVYTYPTLRDLQKRRRDVAQAREFGEELQERLVSSSLGIREMWHLFKVYKTNTKNQAKTLAKSTVAGKAKFTSSSSTINVMEATTQDETAAVLEQAGASKEEQDIKRELLRLLNELADLHERVKNIFIWRRPGSSRIYAIAMAFLTITVFLLPAHYLAKIVYFVGGVLFWHVTPVIAVLSPSDRARLPPAFSDAPTDADYAMELISQRVANGLDVLPSSTKQPYRVRSPTGSDSIAEPSISSTNDTSSSATGSGVDWKKWGERVAVGKSWIEDGKKVLTTGQLPATNIRSTSRSHISPSTSTSTLNSVETYTFPAHHSTAPGLITLTPTVFYFTPLISSQAKLVISYDQICGVKKTGLMKGLSLTWNSTSEQPGNEKEEKFHWVGSRDELFARLIGPDGRRWKRV
ncbi:hypothetical protein BJ138DRAFT_1151815 [Hygrophoropsis aurantiaca]|uniref:Uncharacterized protein n=1 Tax=Hygrophoropsis aurantiaca TaxID=72124 RepID=A0ACB8ACX7_9AGAM|nr:hypothetical protein BJ138DRAFT_1151815 [Hygrophoropsis aurantiaca]